MSGPAGVTVRELAAWGFDAYAYRPTEMRALPTASVSVRVSREAAVSELSPTLQAVAEGHRTRADLHFEMRGLDWSIAEVDLRALLSFQRRVAFPPEALASALPAANDPEGLVSFCFPPSRSVAYHLLPQEGSAAVFDSVDPNLQLRVDPGSATPLSLYAGSPFVEAAMFGGRVFLRDGYHRAYRLLRAGVVRVPAIVVRARTLAELGADRPWFFPPEVLFSNDPPRVRDFLDDAKTISYSRPVLRKRLRLMVKEELVPEELTSQDNKGERR